MVSSHLVPIVVANLFVHIQMEQLNAKAANNGFATRFEYYSHII